MMTRLTIEDRSRHAVPAAGVRRAALLCGAVMWLGACGSAGLPFRPDLAPEVDIIAPDPVELRLAEAAEQASAALDTLARIERVRTPPREMDPIENVPPELAQPMSIDWVGPVEPIIARLAERAGYSFATLGRRPPVEVIVRVRGEQRALIDMLRDIALQAENRANLLVDARRGLVELRYKNAFDE